MLRTGRVPSQVWPEHEGNRPEKNLNQDRPFLMYELASGLHQLLQLMVQKRTILTLLCEKEWQPVRCATQDRQIMPWTQIDLKCILAPMGGIHRTPERRQTFMVLD
jgi:hypothetical protein